MAQDYIEVRLKPWSIRETSSDSLGQDEITGAWENDGVVHLYWPADRWTPEILDAIKEALQRAGGSEPGRSLYRGSNSRSGLE